MSSIQSFLRQRVTGSTMLQGPVATGTDVYFTFVSNTALGNYLGNYPPGYMVDATATVTGLVGGAAPVLRDMGKTIKTYVATAANANPGTPGFFREVQVLIPSTVLYPTSSTNSGVIGQAPGFFPTGGNPGDAGYATFYIPIVVSGVVASASNAVYGAGAALAVSAAGLKVGEQL